jgi:exosortase/archaeosortase family protein
MQLAQKWESLNSKQRNLIAYFLKLALIWLSWKVIIWVLGEQKVPINERMFPALSSAWEGFNNVLAGWLMDATQFLLIKQDYFPLINGRTIWLHPLPGVTIGNYCLGLQLMYYFILVVAITPMSWGRKLLGVFGGIGLVWLLNIARIYGLVLVSYHAPKYLFLAHDHIFNIIVFAVLLPFFYLLSRGKKGPSVKPS